ncbi:multisubstrate pseudouridine synthase 7 [Tanacetum coccineum]
MFKKICDENSGTITFEELKQGLQRVGSNLMESEIKELMDAIHYAEFAAMMRKGDEEVKSRTMKGSLNFDLAQALGIDNNKLKFLVTDTVDGSGASSKCIRVRLSSVSSNDRGQGSNKRKDKGGAPYDSRGPDHWPEHLGKFLK